MKTIWDHLTTHRITTIKGIVYFVLLIMFYKKLITAPEWIMAVGSIQTVSSLFAKDADKVQSKK